MKAAKLEFLDGLGGQTKNPSVGGGGMDIFWNYTFQRKLPNLIVDCCLPNPYTTG